MVPHTFAIPLLSAQGMDVVRKIENTRTGARDKPLDDVTITDCGAETVEEPFVVTKDDARE
jgi:hypothetical protein